MPDILKEQNRKARKVHICNFCGKPIEKGEEYCWAKLSSGGELYEWKNHVQCGFIASELWDYADPWDGMTQDDFMDACKDFCQSFVCPSCCRYDKECMCCADGEVYCIDKIYEFLQSYEIYKDRRDGYFNV